MDADQTGQDRGRGRKLLKTAQVKKYLGQKTDCSKTDYRYLVL
jgi:hypothetical protein